MTERTAEFGGDGVTLEAETLIGLRALVLQPKQKTKAHVAMPGGFRIKQRGSGQDVADSRAYVAGDDLRHIDRGATARTGQIHTKTFHEERDKITHLVADFRPAMLWGMRRAFLSVAAAQALTLIGWLSIEAGGRVGLLAFTGRDAVAIPPRGRTRGMLAVIGGLVKAHELALHNAAGNKLNQSLANALDGLKRISSKGSDVIIATGMDRPGDGFADLMAEMMQRRHPHILIVQDHGLNNLPAGRYPIRLPNGQRKNIGLHSAIQNDWQRAENRLLGDIDVTVPRTHIDAGKPLTELARQVGA